MTRRGVGFTILLHDITSRTGWAENEENALLRRRVPLAFGPAVGRGDDVDLAALDLLNYPYVVIISGGMSAHV